jgi:hypothetical protein
MSISTGPAPHRTFSLHEAPGPTVLCSLGCDGRPECRLCRSGAAAVKAFFGAVVVGMPLGAKNATWTGQC